MAKRKIKKKIVREIQDYDRLDTSAMIDRSNPLRFSDLSLKLPERSPTEVVSIRLPSELLNQLRTLGSQNDIPYQALIKLFLKQGIQRKHRELL